MAWVGISIGGRADLHIIRNGNFMAQRYANEILGPRALPYVVAIGDFCLLMQNNAKPHTTSLVKNFLEAETILHIKKAACSPGLNLIQHS
ncbi:hypothetical protein TNCV_1973061 [Trichonephila clavipes]|nr:hypothetical protein TNCV_1973061 [Trichonephila clavipes]